MGAGKIAGGKIDHMSLWNKLAGSDYLALSVRIFVGAIFIYASIDKISNPAQFARIVYNYHLVPTELINLFALLLPWIELMAGIFIIIGIYKDGAVLLASLMVLSFIIALSINLLRGINIECGCFSVSSKATSNIISLLIRDVGLLVLTIYLYFSKSKRFSLLE
jgi:uncharacterized membrane protein YphA (DoxX/SURF4 family)